ncbi:TIGR03085 family protein [Sanguibacter gelidistatuariae]|uniref:TIGR03085 family protein n=1 Tax=Sanguibacter gelidistatuariae TaxID=1814289 RepID=A0A1G6TEU4_9MICO|nr:TIGR03085 family metal-binding protein [Sanguibacter gelidistatuariae]SDD26835.1 TIGR03085 family protein [Sanguibacter gelidistatuariae]
MATSWNVDERAGLARVLADLGPGLPTLCEGWQTQHLAAHVVLRDRTPWARTARRTEEMAERALDRDAFDRLVAAIAEGPGRLSPGTWAGEAMNLIEFYVHTQDAVRAQPSAGDGPHDSLDPAHTAALWAQFRRFARLLYRPAPAGVILAVDDGPRVVAHRPRPGHGSVVVSGPVTELILHGFGRGAASAVQIYGSPGDADALSERFPAPRSRPRPSRP